MTRTFIPRKCHAAIGARGALTVAIACILPGSIADGIAIMPESPVKLMSVEHPSGEFTVEIQVNEEAAPLGVARSSLVRTARPLFTGHVFVPTHIWDVSNRRQSLSSPATMTTQT